MAFLFKLLSFMSDNKIIALEEKIAHIQHMLDDLNIVMFRQGRNDRKSQQSNQRIKRENGNLKKPSIQSRSHQ